MPVVRGMVATMKRCIYTRSGLVHAIDTMGNPCPVWSDDPGADVVTPFGQLRPVTKFTIVTCLWCAAQLLPHQINTLYDALELELSA